MHKPNRLIRFDWAKEKLSIMTMDEKDKRKYEKYLMDLASERDVMETAHRKGLIQGREEGERAKALETAQKMLQKGLDASLIAEITGLSVEEIEQLRKEMINAQTK